MENSFRSTIDKSKSILILLPTRPSFDQVAAGLSLFLLLRGKKQLQISSPTPMTVEFNKLIGINKISQELGNKNLIIRFTDYRAGDIERVSYDIEDEQFRLTVIPKQQIDPPNKEQVQLSYSGVTADMVVMIGGTDETHFPAISSKELAGADLAHIGTRDISLSSNKSCMSFSRSASSVSEVVYSLIKEGGWTVDEDIATNLLMGIEEGSDRFAVAEVSAETFVTVAELMKAGGRRPAQIPVQKSYPQRMMPGALPPRPTQQVFTGVRPQPATQYDSDKKETGVDETPSDWLRPKIYKGTSIR